MALRICAFSSFQKLKMKMIMFYTLEKFGCGFFPLVKKPPHETTFVENNYFYLQKSKVLRKKYSRRLYAGALRKQM